MKPESEHNIIPKRELRYFPIGKRGERSTSPVQARHVQPITILGYGAVPVEGYSDYKDLGGVFDPELLEKE